jgi:glutamate-1-semialdehyde 2,1-aminomutase
VISRFERSDTLWQRASQTIPLASQTFSKSHQQWVRGAAPLFLSSGRGCRVTDPDGNIYIDYLQGLMTNILGYVDPDVDAAVRRQLELGVSFSLPTSLEADLAERLVEDIPCAEMVRFGKNGSDATTAAIRLARAHTGRDRIALCGYHGWHDWYIGTTTRSAGVPDAIRTMSDTFAFGDVEALADHIVRNGGSHAAVILEPAGAAVPDPTFLPALRALCDREGVLLIFDEIVTGFRMGPGGAQEHYGVTPDLACFGKAMANGLPISAVVGRREVMIGMEDIFFSGTYGGEALSLAAAIATLDKLKAEKVAPRLWALGETLMARSNDAVAATGLGEILAFSGDGWWPRLRIENPPVDQILLISLLRQEFIAAGLILASSYNLCLPHEDDNVQDETIERLIAALSEVRRHLDSPGPEAALRGARVQPTFSVR